MLAGWVNISENKGTYECVGLGLRSLASVRWLVNLLLQYDTAQSHMPA